MVWVVVNYIIVGDEFLEWFIGVDMSIKLKLMGVDVGFIGDVYGWIFGCLIYIYEN